MLGIEKICFIYSSDKHISKLYYDAIYSNYGASQVTLVLKNPSANAEDIRDMVLVPGSERPAGGEHGNPLQYSCLENPMYGGTWRATVCRVEKNWTRLKRLSMHTRVTIIML